MSQQVHTRIPLHTRAVTYRGFFRSDGLWDIEGRLVDTKDYPIDRFDRGTLEPGSPAHDMFIRLTLDADLKIVDVETGMPSTPFDGCLDAAEPLRAMIGVTVGRGWRKAIDAAMGGVNDARICVSCCLTWPPLQCRPFRRTFNTSASKAASRHQSLPVRLFMWGSACHGGVMDPWCKVFIRSFSWTSPNRQATPAIHD